MSIEIADTKINYSFLISNGDLTEKTKENISQSNILLLPEFNFRGCTKRVFYDETSDFYKYVKSEKPEMIIHLCENEGEEKTISLQSDEFWFPIIYIAIESFKDIIYPIIISLICDYLSKKKKKISGELTNVHCTLIIEDKSENRSKSIKYNGPVNGLKDLKKMNLTKIFEG